MNKNIGFFFIENPAIAIVFAVVLIAMVYIFSRQLKPQEMKRFSIFMGLGIALLVALFLLAMFFPQVVKYYPFLILGIAIAIGAYLYQRLKIH